MKSILFAALLACAFVSARADLPGPRPHIPTPQPSILTVSNLSAFPKYKFTVALDQEDRLQPIAEKKVYLFRFNAWLFVQEGDSKPHRWATVNLSPVRGGGVVNILIKDVHAGSHGIEVSYDQGGDATPRPSKKSASRAAEAWPHFLLAGLGGCGLVLLAPRARRRDL